MRIVCRRLAIVSVGAFTFLLGVAAQGHAQTAQLCLAGQLRGASNACKAVAKCYSTAMKKGTAVSEACVSVQSTRLGVIYGEIEALGNCLTSDVSSEVVAAFGDQIEALGTALTLGGGKCAATKMAALGKECAGYLRCYAAGAAMSETVDPSCLAAHEGRLTKSFTKAEAKGGCAVTGDQATLEAMVGDIAAGTYTLLRGTGTTTTVPTSSSTSTVTMP
ncbi:MAG TPA: hypothetical protein VEL28_20860 [Candidatus Binatia bacterium]|nr:hypothetical protein [Candidatus Binatia bacterium]